VKEPVLWYDMEYVPLRKISVFEIRLGNALYGFRLGLVFINFPSMRITLLNY